MCMCHSGKVFSEIAEGMECFCFLVLFFIPRSGPRGDGVGETDVPRDFLSKRLGGRR